MKTMPATAAELRAKLRSLDGRGYKAYEAIHGEYQCANFRLAIERVQGDPFASPSRLSARVEQGFPAELFASKVRRIALEDYITRRFAAAVGRIVRGRRGTGHSGLIAIDAGGQEILERTSCRVSPAFVEVRFVAGLPAAGRTILGREAEAMLLEEVPALVQAALLYSSLPAAGVQAHVAVAEDQEALREQLAQRRLVAFVADGAVLPRASGVSDLPLASPQVVPFPAPQELKVELRAPNRGPVVGLGLPEGVTLIVGGGYHGKSTLLQALARGIYNHIPGDGREYVVTRSDAIKIRAEDGRRVEKVDISPFIATLPFGQDTVAFSTENASGSTSQAANIVEALEAGARLLLIDEDTSATNFMIRDARMQELVPKAKEPITPFIDQVRHLFAEHGVSSVLVVGGSGDYFEVADTVIWMDTYRPQVVTAQARRIAQEHPSQRRHEAAATFGALRPRIPLPDSLDPWRGQRVKVEARGLEAIRFGQESIDLRALEQLVDPSQTRAIADALLYGLRRGYIDGRRPLAEALESICQDIDRHGLEVLTPFPGPPGDYARPRPLEVAAALNRLRSLSVRQAG